MFTKIYRVYRQVEHCCRSGEFTVFCHVLCVINICHVWEVSSNNKHLMEYKTRTCVDRRIGPDYFDYNGITLSYDFCAHQMGSNLWYNRISFR